MKLTAGLFLALVAGILLDISSVMAATIPFNQNLIFNGDAESDIGSTTGAVIGAVTGFTTAGNFTVVKYGTSGGFPLPTSPGPVDRGLNFFAGGPNNSASSAYQVIDVSSIASSIDLGSMRYQLSGFLGGYTDHQNDQAVLTARFLNSDDSPIGIGSIGPVLNADRNNVTGLLERTTEGAVPVGSRSIEIRLALTRTAGSYNDGYADNLTLKLTPVPVPAAALLFVPGLIGIGVLANRKRS
ncbi:MAG: hypothetical protein IPP12_06120 [Nitrospira sp.]|nr:hypothetical protein [Nitrospira sp.]